MCAQAVETKTVVITGLVPVIHVLLWLFRQKEVDGRDEPGHDGIAV
jgi:hypothetical protein